LTDLHVVRLELERALVRVARLVELSFVLVADRQIVERRCVGGVDLDRLFPAVNRLAPEAALGDRDPEGDLFLRVAPRVGERRRNRQQGDRRAGRDPEDHA
jgi:hypothetical protein